MILLFCGTRDCEAGKQNKFYIAGRLLRSGYKQDKFYNAELLCEEAENNDILV
jgi:hypothetical protein